MTEVTSFEALPLAAPLQDALRAKGYTTPSPIQARAIPVLLEGRDLLACAQTGTGKTAAFALPMLNVISSGGRKPRRGEIKAVVLVPTRELAVQVEESFRTYGKNVRCRIGLVHGGVSQRPQERAIAGGLDVLVATPGRLLDLMEQGIGDLSGVQTLVLDEADRMLDMGFIHDIRKIAAEIPADRQTLLFSATMASEIAKLAKDLLQNPEEIRIAPAATTAELVDQYVCFVDRKNKRELLEALLEYRREVSDQEELTLVFSRTKHGANRLAQQLSRSGFPAEAIHGNKTQAARLKALERFRRGKSSVMVATDVAARGIDVRNITLVVNFDLPTEAESYVHRIGRTGRAGESGFAISFTSEEELGMLRDIEKLVRQDIPVDVQQPFHDEALAEKYARGGHFPKADKKPGGRRGGASRGGRSSSQGRRSGSPRSRGRSRSRGRARQAA